jgi:YVTN family beta-propeller protein
MKLSHVLLAMGCPLSLASAQWLETTVPLPDSLGSIGNPTAVVCDSLDNKLFAGGDGGVLVADGTNNARLARVWTGSTVPALGFVRQNDKVYCANSGSNSVTVIDGASNSVLTTIGVGVWPNRVCVANQNGFGISVLRDSILVGVEQDGRSTAAGQQLRIAPNPVRVPAAIRYALPVSGRASLKLYDVGGRIAATLAEANSRRAGIA